jgi:hypothetical protein
MKKVVFTLLFIASSVVFYAQPPDPPAGTPPCGGPFGAVCPIDGGVSLLIAAGLAMGGKKAYDLGKRKPN